jgi:hypothetical protein
MLTSWQGGRSGATPLNDWGGSDPFRPSLTPAMLAARSIPVLRLSVMAANKEAAGGRFCRVSPAHV